MPRIGYEWGSPLLCLLLSGVACGQPTTRPDSAVDKNWQLLADDDAERAYRAFWALARQPDEAVAFLGQRLKPAQAADPKELQQWIADLGSDRFEVREKAARELDKLGGLAKAALEQTAAGNPPLEARRRIEHILKKMMGPITHPAGRREVRAVELLEGVATDEARAVLRKLAAGAPAARLTQEAIDALARLEARDKAGVPTSLFAMLNTKPSTTDAFGDPLPAGVAARLGTSRFRLSGSHGVHLAFSADGKTLASSDSESPLTFWDAATGKPQRKWDDAREAFALSADGKLLAYRVDGNVCLFDLAANKELFRASLPLAITRLAFTRGDNELWASAEEVGFLRFEVPSGKRLEHRKAGAAGEKSIYTWSADGVWLLLGIRAADVEALAYASGWCNARGQWGLTKRASHCNPER
ncbi:MAG: WD40 repeat domain-containing protein [Gemmataceae bacterium]|nr:WD40 repeat domain-containing protein [Gemmataceae bacterium]